MWGFGDDSAKEMEKCCRPLKVEVFLLEDENMLKNSGWKAAEPAAYHGRHGMSIWEGEPEKTAADVKQ